MPALPLSNNFEGGTNGATIATTDTGSGDAWSGVTIGTSATLTYDTTHPAHGSLGAKFVQPVTFVSTYLLWSGYGSLTSNVFHRMYLYLTANPATALFLMRAGNNAAAACAYLQINTAGKIQCQNPAGSVVAVGSVAVALNQPIRIEFRVLPSTTAGEVEWRLFNTADSTTADDTASASALVLAANEDQTRFGNTSTPGPASYTSWFDDIAVSSTDWIGPAVAGPLPEKPIANVFQPMKVRH